MGNRSLFFVSLFLLSSTMLHSGCGNAGGKVTRLTGYAVLPADTFTPGPTVGRALDPMINGRSMPMDQVPVQGFSSLIPMGDDEYLALQDNGFGTRANSPAYPLQWFRLKVVLAEDSSAEGKVTVLGRTLLSDPDGQLREPAAGEPLTGAHLDPESFVRMDDGSFWIGEEFGPFLIHVDATGKILGPAVAVPLVEELEPFGRGHQTLMTPDHPDLRHQAEANQLANLPRSGGLEGLARTPDGQHLYVAVEKALVEDPDRTRRLILQFDPASGQFTGRHFFYFMDAPDISIASLEAVNRDVLLITERDGHEGQEAAIKRIYRIDLKTAATDGHLKKTLVCDLLKIRDDQGLTQPEAGSVGLGEAFGFPFVTPECLVVLDDHHILVANDNNYPMSSGRRPTDTPDDNEFIRLHLERGLQR